MKPRLKLHHMGGLSVVQQGSIPWTELQAERYLRRHYRELRRFAAFVGVPAYCMSAALGQSGIDRAGDVALVRQVLGLPSNPSPRAMHPEQIKAAIRMTGTTPSAIADHLHRSRMTVSNVIHGRSVSRHIAEHIGRLLGKKPSDLWPGRYQPQPITARTARRSAR